jgi:hypothetical protein
MTDNQMQSQIDARRDKQRWVGEDDEKVLGQMLKKPEDKEGKYALEPMRIRSFEVHYGEVQPQVAQA